MTGLWPANERDDVVEVARRVLKGIANRDNREDIEVLETELKTIACMLETARQFYAGKYNPHRITAAQVGSGSVASHDEIGATPNEADGSKSLTARQANEAWDGKTEMPFADMYAWSRKKYSREEK